MQVGVLAFWQSEVCYWTGTEACRLHLGSKQVFNYMIHPAAMCDPDDVSPAWANPPVADFTDLLYLLGSPHKAVEQQPAVGAESAWSGVMGKSGYMINGYGPNLRLSATFVCSAP